MFARFTLALLLASTALMPAVAQGVADPPEREAAVAIGGRGWVLPRVGASGLTVQSMNVARVRVRVLRVSAARLAGEQGRRGRVDPAKTVFSPYELRRLAEADATEVWSGVLTTGPGRNAMVETAFPLAGIVDPGKPGAYLVLVEDAARPAVTLAADRERYEPADFDDSVAGHWVLSTDLAIASAQGLDGLHVVVRSFGTAAPRAGVRLQLLSRGQDVLAEAVTDADGAAVFAPGLLRGQRGAAATVLVAHADGDMALQDLTAPAFDLADRGAEGRPSPGPVEAYLYTDRGIYRPGETVNLVALLRTGAVAAVEDAALTVVLRRPDGVEASRTVLPPAPDAGFVEALALSRTAAQGSWTIEAYVDPSLPAVGRVSVQVQDFVPQQLAVALTGLALDGSAHLVGALDGRFLYGAPGAGLHAEGEVRLVRDEHPVADARDYVFGVADEVFPDAPQPLDLGDADPGGHVAVDAHVVLPEGVASPLRAVVEAGLVEPTGRAVRQTVSVPVRHGLLLGLRPRFKGRVDSGGVAGFDVRAFDAEGRPVARAGVAWRLVREVTHYDWWRGASGSGGWTFHTYASDVEVGAGVVDIGADGPATVGQAEDWGSYRMIVSDAASGTASSVRFSVGWGEGSADTGVPDRLEVSTDRAVVGVGQVVHVHVRGPFAGPGQLTVESAGRVLETRRIELAEAGAAEGATVDLVAQGAWGPGVHVLVEAFRPLVGGAVPEHTPVRAVGLVWVATDPAPHTLTVSLQAPALVAPRGRVAVPVHVAGAHGRAFVTLAAVDEGVLQLTRFSSPDPLGALLGRTRFGLDLRDDYGRLLDGHADVGAVREGGDEGAALGGQGLAVSTTRVVSLFHGPIELDAAGDAVVTLDVPDFAGQLRLMAVAFDHDAAGRAEAAMTVRDPVVAELALPRFLAPGDVAEVGVSLHDTDGPEGAYRLEVTASGAAGVRGAGTLDMTLARGERREARVQLAGEGVGVGHVTAVLTGPGGLRVVHEWDIAVRSPHPDVVLSRTDTQGPGEVYRPGAAMFAPFLPGSARLTVGYAATAGIDVPGLLQSLYTYPYGCTEQLASAAFPLLFYRDARLLGRAGDGAGVARRVQEAIDTMIDRQDGAGRFGLWRVGDGSASVWLNVYALDFLLHAREAGFRVPERVTAQASAWIERRLASEGGTDEGAYAEPAAPTRAYAAYVLARTSRVDPSRLRALAGALDRTEGVVAWRDVGTAAPLSLAQLGGAEVLMGDGPAGGRAFEMALANLAVAPDVYWSHAYFWSRLRDEAGVLAIAAETGQDRIAATMLERLRRESLQPEALNTQEKAWLLLAAHALNRRGGTRMLALDGGAPGVVGLPYAVTLTAAEVTQGRSVRNAGGEAVFRTVTLRGAPKEASPAVSAGFELRRQTFTLGGERMDDAALTQTDRFVVVLSGAVAEGAFRRAVVVDPLPAGLEIEGLVKDGQYGFVGQLSTLRAHEERDDRFIAAFDVGTEARGVSVVDETRRGALEPEQFRVAYVVRAVTPGRFVRPETVVEDMYHPDVMARTGVGRVAVAPR